jgi:dipeptidyl aminopeptidase/acylaminoacyl peptidase
MTSRLEPALLHDLVHAWGSWSPTMTADGQRVAFVSDRRGVPELWVQDVPDSDDLPEPTVLTLSADPVLSVHWSADGEWLACLVATGGGYRTQVWVVRPDGSDAHVVAGGPDQHATLGPWTRTGHRLAVTIAGSGADDGNCNELVDPGTGARTGLASGGLGHVLDLSADERFALLRDGTRGAQFCRMHDRELGIDHPLLPYPETGATDAGLLRPAPPGIAGAPMVAYLASDAGQPWRTLLAVPVGSDGVRGEVGGLASRDDGELEHLDADESGRTLVLGWNIAGRSEIELLDTATGRRTGVADLPGDVVEGCVMSRDGRSVLLCVDGPACPRQLWRLDTADGSIRPVSASSLSRDVPIVVPTLTRFVGHDGMPLTGWLYRPPDAVLPGPALLSLHGGPESQERPGFNPQHQAMVAAGITVFAPNVRGSSGFGRAFVHADDRYGRYDAIADVASCLEFLVEAGIADPERVGVSGRSYGGYLTLAAMARYPDLFACGVDICGMSDLVTFFRDTEAWIAAASVTKYGDPATDGILLRELSPIHQAARISAPLLVVHGELDTNVPLGEALQIVAALRELGREVEFLQLDGEGHEYRRASSRQLLLDRMLEFVIRQLSGKSESLAIELRAVWDEAG